MRSSFLGCFVLLSAVVLAQTSTPASLRTATARVLNDTERKQIVSQAQQSYYNLRKSGVQDFRFEAVLDWDSMFAQIHADHDALDHLLPILKSEHVQVLIGPDGASTISTRTDTLPRTEDAARRLRQMSQGIEETLTGFLQTWSPFMVTSALPPSNGDYTLEDTGDLYRITYQEGTAHVVTTMDHAFAIKEMKVAAAKFTGTIRPRFFNSSAGYVLAGYSGLFRPAGSSENQMLIVDIHNQDTEGFQLPEAITATIPASTGNLRLTFAFNSYKITKTD